MLHKCNKCNKTFKSDYTYDLHKNKKIACDTLFICVKCKKEFKTNYSLTAHKNKKIPCVSDEIELQIKLEEIKLNIKKEDVKLELEHRKLDIKEKEIQAKKEMIELKKQAFIEKNTCIEKLKTERKEKTSIVINNNNTINITNNVIQHIQNKYPDNFDITAFKEFLQNTYNDLTDPDTMEPYELMLKFYDNHTNSTSLFNNIMSHAFPDDMSKCLFYIKEIGKFFGLYKKKEGFGNDVRETDFDIELKGVCDEFIEKIVKFMMDNVSKFRSKLDFETNNFDKQMELFEFHAAIKTGRSGVKELSAKFFEEDVLV